MSIPFSKKIPHFFLCRIGVLWFVLVIIFLFLVFFGLMIWFKMWYYLFFFLFQKKIITSFFPFIKPLQSIFLMTQVLFLCNSHNFLKDVHLISYSAAVVQANLFSKLQKKTCSSFHGSQHNLSLTRWKFL